MVKPVVVPVDMVVRPVVKPVDVVVPVQVLVVKVVGVASQGVVPNSQTRIRTRMLPDNICEKQSNWSLLSHI